MSKNFVLTGASSGIGKAVALEMARRGWNLGLLGRRPEVLDEVKKEIQEICPDVKVETASMDVRDYGRVREAVFNIAEKLGGMDVFFANAGVAPGGKIGRSDFSAARDNIDTNLTGAMATVDAATAFFLAKGKGHIAGTSSVAALRGLPNASAYSASKAGFFVYLEALRAETLRKNIDVTVLYPGYIDTPLNNMMKSRPFLISVEKGAKKIASIIEKRKKRAYIPSWPWVIIAPLMKVVPARFLAG